MSSGARDGDYAAAFERVVSPVLEMYAPELVLISAGFDAHVNKPAEIDVIESILKTVLSTSSLESEE